MNECRRSSFENMFIESPFSPFHFTESDPVEHLHATLAGPCDSNLQRSGNRNVPKKTKQYGRGEHLSVETKPTSDLIQDPRIMKLFKLAKERKFVELKAAHERLLKEGADSDEKSLDVYLYSRLMTQCVRHIGNETALPVFELMEQAGVTPNVVPYTIVIRALMNLAVSSLALRLLNLCASCNFVISAKSDKNGTFCSSCHAKDPYCESHFFT